MRRFGLHALCLVALTHLLMACSSQAPAGGTAYTAGSPAADSGMPQACVSSESCGQVETCLVYCEAGAAKLGCHVPAPNAVGYGEPCTGTSCREGICAAGGGKLSPARCMRLCDPSVECLAGERCETRDIRYGCESGATPLRLSLCLPGA